MVSDDDPLNTYVDAAAKVLALPIKSEWKPRICADLATTLRIAALVNEFPLPDEAEPGPVFSA